MLHLIQKVKLLVFIVYLSGRNSYFPVSLHMETQAQCLHDLEATVYKI